MGKKTGISGLSDEELLNVLDANGDLDDREIARIASDAPYSYDDEPPEKYYDPENGWWPSLYPSQMEAFNCDKPYILLHSERYGGKTIVLLNMLVRHCYSFDDALAMIVSITKSPAKSGGAWTKLFTEVLPEWEEGIGLAYTDSKMDAERNHCCKIQNIYGSWSYVMLKSIPAESLIAERWKGAEPTFIGIDELTETPIDATGYFDKVSQQLFRKKARAGRPPYKYQYVAACNPADEGEDHWVFQKFIKGPDAEKEKKAREKWKERFANFRIPIAENVNADNLEEYIENLRSTCTTPDEVARAMEGKWVKKIKGKGIFSHYFQPAIHIVGDVEKNIRLVPVEAKPITIGYDLGDVNQGVVFYQDIPYRDKLEDKIKTVSMVFDEIVLIQEQLEGWETLVRMILNKMIFWCDYKKHPFDFRHISDKSAFDRYRIGQGGIDQKQIEKYSKKIIGEEPKRFGLLRQKMIKMVDAPKMGGSVEERVKILMNKLIRGEILIDVRCKNVVETLSRIVAKPNNPLAPAPGSPYKHALDALTYPMFYDSAGENLRAKAIDMQFGVR